MTLSDTLCDSIAALAEGSSDLRFDSRRDTGPNLTDSGRGVSSHGNLGLRQAKLGRGG